MKRNISELVEAIEKRHSVRTYEPVMPERQVIDAIKSYVKEAVSGYEDKIRIVLIENREVKNQTKLGTYGVIKGTEYYLAAACKEGEYEEVILGYVLEKIVLYCTSLGLGTVWLGGTYKKSSFAEAMDLKEDEEIKIVVPIGYEAEKKTLLAKVMGGSSKKRMDFGAVFFDGTPDVPLTKQKAEPYTKALEMLRIAPSAVNKQPWRVIKEGDNLHFYATDFKAYRKIDLGIGLAHFHLTVEQQEISGQFKRVEEKISTPFAYLVSWIRE